MRTIHHAVSVKDTSDVRLIVESASSGGGKWGFPVRLSTIDVPVEQFETFLHAPRWSGSRVKWNVIETFEVDGRNRGPRSGFGKTLTALIDHANEKGEARDLSRLEAELRAQVVRNALISAAADMPQKSTSARRAM